MDLSEFGLYIHIPFCISKCIYCDFLSFPLRSFTGSDIELYFSVLNNEIKEKSDYVKDRKVTSVFIGGGTPSSVPPIYIFNLINTLRKYYNISSDAEITIEVNPGSAHSEDFVIYKEAGINRISFGVQSMNNDVLRFLKRIHTREDFLDSFFNAQKAGINNINADLIFGIPNQSINDFKQSLKEINVLGIPHISAYSLIIEPGTCLYSLIENGTIEELPDYIDRDMYHYCIEFLKGKGYIYYEISNFAMKGFLCNHNILYWKCNEYEGLGLGSSSYINSIRYKNTENLDEYIKYGFFKKYEIENLSQTDKMNEFMMLGFRLTEGPDPTEFYNRFGVYYHEIFCDKLINLESKGLILKNANRYRLTDKGLDLANIVFSEFI